VVIGAIYGYRTLTDSPVVTAVAQPDPAEVNRMIGVFEARLDTSRVEEQDPSPLDQAVLGRLYLARATADHNVPDFELAVEHLSAAAISSPDPAVLGGLAQAHLALHEFTTARQLALELLEHTPDEGQVGLGILIDADLALGNYGLAAQHLERLTAAMPDEPAVLVRRAQHAWLTGDITTALDVSKEAAVNARKGGMEAGPQAHYWMVAGRMAFEGGHYRQAEGHLRRSLDLDPTRPGALYELARVRAARSDLEGAIELLERSVALVPEPVALAALGDLYLAVGDAAASERTYQMIASGGDRLDNRTIALAYAARDIRSAEALELARSELSQRDDRHTWHTYALALLRSDRLDEAWEAARRSIGPADARLLYHAGVVAAAGGHQTEAIDYLQRALELNPNFHPLEADQARSVLAELRP
jgi:tetratricopeptide (TPR) repeat protein